MRFTSKTNPTNTTTHYAKCLLYNKRIKKQSKRYTTNNRHFLDKIIPQKEIKCPQDALAKNQAFS